jgi:hypothetical protein
VRRKITLRDKHELLYKHAALCIGISLATTTAAKPPPDPGEGPPPDPGPPPAVPPPPRTAAAAGRGETRHDLWRVGDAEVVVRSRVRARRWGGGDGRSTQGQAVVVRGKAEYLVGQQGDLPEDTTLLERARRWAALTFHPGAELVVSCWPLITLRPAVDHSRLKGVGALSGLNNQLE